MKQKVFFMIFQEVSVARNCPAPLTILNTKKGLCVINEFSKFLLKMIAIS